MNDLFIDSKNRVWIATNNGFAKYTDSVDAGFYDNYKSLIIDTLI
ncbi:hypothetical protein E1140_15095 [Fulvivirga lutimaris]|nr:hypothetical protein [Fulvivirga lutimaris]